MRRLWVVLAIGLTLSGCALIKEQQDNWKACKSDPVCSEQAKKYQSSTETLSALPISMIPIPGVSAVAPKVLGYIAFGLSMLIGGHTLRKKPE